MKNEAAATEYNMNTLEIGPRFDLNLYKIEEGFLNNPSSIIQHAKLSEVEAMKIKISKFKENKVSKKGKIKIVTDSDQKDAKKVNNKDEIGIEAGINTHGYKDRTKEESDDGEENNKSVSAENKEIRMLQKKRVQIQQKLKLKTKSKDPKKDRDNLKRKREEMQKNR